MNDTGRLSIRSACLAALTFLLSAGSVGCTSHMTMAQFNQRVAQAEQPVMVMFYRDECHRCQALKPTWEMLQAEYADQVDFVRVDTDSDDWDIITSNRIKPLPTVLLFIDGQEVGRWTDEQDADIYREVLDAELGV